MGLPIELESVASDYQNYETKKSLVLCVFLALENPQNLSIILRGRNRSIIFYVSIVCYYNVSKPSYFTVCMQRCHRDGQYQTILKYYF